MTSARAIADRVENDAYYTDDRLAVVLAGLLEAMPLDFRRARLVVEPSVGAGAFVRAVRPLVPSARVVGVDINPHAPGLPICDEHHVGDWPTIAATMDATPDWIVGNPPYRHAAEHIDAALNMAPNVAMLLRLAMLEGGARFGWWSGEAGRRLHTVYVLAERPSFTGGGTDSAAYAWFVWSLYGRSEGPAIRVVSWRDGARLAGGAP